MNRAALDVQDGVNPRGIARLLVAAVDLACEEEQSTDGAGGNAAVYLIMDKLASLGLYPQHFGGDFPQHYATCMSTLDLEEAHADSQC
jgi:hypothetical protein